MLIHAVLVCCLNGQQRLPRSFFSGAARTAGKTIIGYCGIGLTNNLHDCFYIEACERDDVVFIIVGDGADRIQFNHGWRVRMWCSLADICRPGSGLSAALRYPFLSTLPSKVWDYGQSMNKVADYMLAAAYIVAQYTGYQSFINGGKVRCLYRWGRAKIVLML